MPVVTVNTSAVLAALRPLWNAKPETARRLRGRFERVLGAARVEGLRVGENPARWAGHLKELLPKPAVLRRGHHAAMPYADVPVFVSRLRERPAQAARALELLILTAARSGELRGMTWGEVDLDAALWTVPATRMKAARPHRVPLCPRAVVLLKERRPTAPAGELLVFAGPRGLRSDAFFAVLLRRMKAVEVTPHGFRSSFRDWAADETDHPREVIEAALAHLIGDETERAYRRGDALTKRRALMADWAAYIH